MDEEIRLSGADHPHVQIPRLGELDAIWARRIVLAFDADTAEIKRMYVKKQNRGKRYASFILIELEKWAKELSFQKCILETGINQKEAIRLYKRNGYTLIPNYGQYAEVDKSFCFEKVL